MNLLKNADGYVGKQIRAHFEKYNQQLIYIKEQHEKQLRSIRKKEEKTTTLKMKESMNASVIIAVKLLLMFFAVKSAT